MRGNAGGGIAVKDSSRGITVINSRRRNYFDT